jgi:L-2-hydroxyglutarate oxidase
VKIIVIGGGIVGLATAYRLGERIPGAGITLPEKENEVGKHQTGHNSGVRYCGLYSGFTMLPVTPSTPGGSEAIRLAERVITRRPAPRLNN